jgi:hypothetical protein
MVYDVYDAAYGEPIARFSTRAEAEADVARRGEDRYMVLGRRVPSRGIALGAGTTARDDGLQKRVAAEVEALKRIAQRHAGLT